MNAKIPDSETSHFLLKIKSQLKRPHTPEGYFETFPDRLMHKIYAESSLQYSPQTVVQPFPVLKAVPVMLAFAASICLAFFLQFQSVPTPLPLPSPRSEEWNELIDWNQMEQFISDPSLELSGTLPANEVEDWVLQEEL
ncbi:MAG: hypothetical protein EBS07_07970 [Sphingobacteriia bacterium]|nr:hypothetical protein [Sphingobacteriia bacterium]